MRAHGGFTLTSTQAEAYRSAASGSKAVTARTCRSRPAPGIPLPPARRHVGQLISPSLPRGSTSGLGGVAHGVGRRSDEARAGAPPGCLQVLEHVHHVEEVLLVVEASV